MKLKKYKCLLVFIFRKKKKNRSNFKRFEFQITMENYDSVVLADSGKSGVT